MSKSKVLLLRLPKLLITIERISIVMIRFATFPASLLLVTKQVSGQDPLFWINCGSLYCPVAAQNPLCTQSVIDCTSTDDLYNRCSEDPPTYRCLCGGTLITNTANGVVCSDIPPETDAPAPTPPPSPTTFTIQCGNLFCPVETDDPQCTQGSVDCTSSTELFNQCQDDPPTFRCMCGETVLTSGDQCTDQVPSTPAPAPGRAPITPDPGPVAPAPVASPTAPQPTSASTLSFCWTKVLATATVLVSTTAMVM